MKIYKAAVALALALTATLMPAKKAEAIDISAGANFDVANRFVNSNAFRPTNKPVNNAGFWSNISHDKYSLTCYVGQISESQGRTWENDFMFSLNAKIAEWFSARAEWNRYDIPDPQFRAEEVCGGATVDLNPAGLPVSVDGVLCRDYEKGSGTIGGVAARTGTSFGPLNFFASITARTNHKYFTDAQSALAAIMGDAKVSVDLGALIGIESLAGIEIYGRVRATEAMHDAFENHQQVAGGVNFTK